MLLFLTATGRRSLSNVTGDENSPKPSTSRASSGPTASTDAAPSTEGKVHSYNNVLPCQNYIINFETSNEARN